VIVGKLRFEMMQ